MKSKHTEPAFKTLAQTDVKKKTPEAGVSVTSRQGVADAKHFAEENEK
ncbi:MAG: DUF3787 domain-containing protein [Clostridiales bacterium]|jgi:hypothetical protein|nr:DUF3787 domain-containing protein [Clostridiales bacterium]